MPLWREARLQVKMHKTHHVRSTFGNHADEKLHAAVARNAFASQNVKKLTVSDHFEVLMWKSCTPLWREAQFRVKCAKHLRFGTLLEVPMSKRRPTGERDR